MRTILKLSLREMYKSILWTLLMFLVCLIAMRTIITSITNATSSVYQRRVFENHIGYDMSRVIHLYYSDVKETTEFADTLCDFLKQLNTIDGVASSGRFDQMGVFFDELKNNPDYQQVNIEILQDVDRKRLNTPGIVRMMYADEAVWKLMKGISVTYDYTLADSIPLYVSESFEEILPIGTRITCESTREIYEVEGYIEKSLTGFNENDLIRFPMISLDGYFIAPFPPSSDLDIMSQLSCLHNTYVFLKDDAEVQIIQQNISDLAQSYGFQVSGNTLSEEYESYCKEMDVLAKNQIVLAFFISVMAISSVIAVFTTNTILKKRQYGILLANGYTKKDLVMIIALEVCMIVLFSGMLAWLIKLQEIISSNSLGIALFRDVLLSAHLHFTFPICGAVCAALIILSILLPAMNIFHYQPSELM